MSNDEKRDVEDRSNDAMAKIVSDTVGEPHPENKKDRSAAHKSARPSKSARPRKITYVPIDESEFEPIVIPEKKKHKALKVTGMIAAMVFVVVGCAYAGLSYYYTSHFFEGTTINGIDSSNRTAYEVEQEIAKKMEGYSIQVKARNQDTQTIEGADIDYRYISSGEVLKLLKEQKPYEWVKGFFEKTTYTASEQTAFDKLKLETEVKGLNCARKENQVAPENAYVSFNDSEFTIVPDTEGSQLKVKEAYQMISDAISNDEGEVDLGSNPDAYVKADVTSDNADLQATVDAYNNFARASITYTFGDETVTLDGSTIKNWLQFGEKGQLIQDDASFKQHIVDYVAQLAADHDTVGTERQFQTTSGRTVSVSGSAYGWKIDQDAEYDALIANIQNAETVTREPEYSSRAANHTAMDMGNTYAEVDLTTQHMWFIKDGQIALETDIVTGNPNKGNATPQGTYSLTYKSRNKTLRGTKKPDGTYEYETPVAYWMPFNRGIGFHDATWQSSFGGSRYLSHGSHGCVNMPKDKAAALYDLIPDGCPVVCHY